MRSASADIAQLAADSASDAVACWGGFMFSFSLEGIERANECVACGSLSADERDDFLLRFVERCLSLYEAAQDEARREERHADAYDARGGL